MTTIRVARRRRYAQVDQGTINDSRLSFRARGVLVWLLEKPDNWNVDARLICQQGPEGRDAIRSALLELERLGYLVRHKHRGSDGAWFAEHVVYERPNGADHDGKPAKDERAESGHHHDGKPDPVSQTRLARPGFSGPVVKLQTKIQRTPTPFEPVAAAQAALRARGDAQTAADRARTQAEPRVAPGTIRQLRESIR